MKLNKLPLAVFSTTYLASLQFAQADDYVVKKGDTFTKIAAKYAKGESDLSYSQSLALILKINEKKNISEFDNLRIGQKIALPSSDDIKTYLDFYQKKYPKYWNPSSWKVDSGHRKKHVAKPGDTLAKIAQSKVPSLSIMGERGSLALMLDLNKQIVNKNIIFAGQEIILPTNEDVNEWKGERSFFDRFSQGGMVPLIDQICQNSIQKKCYALLNKELLSSRKRVDYMENLKHLLEFSRECRHESVESYFLKLISFYIKPQREMKFLREINRFFKANNYFSRSAKMS